MAYKVPFYVFWKLLHLDGEVLRTALGKNFLTCLVRPLYCLDWIIFGNCHQFYFRRQFLPKII